jgi:hypothetical protein
MGLCAFLVTTTTVITLRHMLYVFAVKALLAIKEYSFELGAVYDEGSRSTEGH